MSESICVVDGEMQCSAERTQRQPGSVLFANLLTSWAIWAGVRFLPSLRRSFAGTPNLHWRLRAFSLGRLLYVPELGRCRACAISSARFLPARIPIAWLHGAHISRPLCFTFSAALVRFIYRPPGPNFSRLYLPPQFVLWILAFRRSTKRGALVGAGSHCHALLRDTSPLVASVV
jgi:hypothetical protein